MSPEIKTGAVIVSDAHYSPVRPWLDGFLRDIETGRIPATQLILLGDIFDLLIGPLPWTVAQNREVIDRINRISGKIPVLYFEGNHDFLLRPLFPQVGLFPIEEQPVLAVGAEGSCWRIAHGDYKADWCHRVYTGLIRHPVLVRLLHVCTLNVINNWLLKRVQKQLDRKKICREFDDFEGYIHRKLSTVFADGIYLEGHYHQDRQFRVNDGEYINAPGFACNKSYLVVTLSNAKVFLQRQVYEEYQNGRDQ